MLGSTNRNRPPSALLSHLPRISWKEGTTNSPDRGRAGTRCRFRELTLIEWADVDFKERNLTIRAEVAKGKRQDIQALDEHTLAALRKWRRRLGATKLGGYIFPGKNVSGIRGRLNPILE